MTSPEAYKATDACRSNRKAMVLAIGHSHTNYILQFDYPIPDYYFRITNSENKVDLKHKFKRICTSLSMDLGIFCLLYQ